MPENYKTSRFMYTDALSFINFGKDQHGEMFYWIYIGSWQRVDTIMLGWIVNKFLNSKHTPTVY